MLATIIIGIGCVCFCFVLLLMLLNVRIVHVDSEESERQLLAFAKELNELADEMRKGNERRI